MFFLPVPFSVPSVDLVGAVTSEFFHSCPSLDGGGSGSCSLFLVAGAPCVSCTPSSQITEHMGWRGGRGGVTTSAGRADRTGGALTAQRPCAQTLCSAPKPLCWVGQAQAERPLSSVTVSPGDSSTGRGDRVFDLSSQTC